MNAHYVILWLPTVLCEYTKGKRHHAFLLAKQYCAYAIVDFNVMQNTRRKSNRRKLASFHKADSVNEMSL